MATKKRAKENSEYAKRSSTITGPEHIHHAHDELTQEIIEDETTITTPKTIHKHHELIVDDIESTITQPVHVLGHAVQEIALKLKKAKIESEVHHEKNSPIKQSKK